MAKVATSALEAKEFGFFRPSDVIVFNTNELLHVAIGQARAMADAGYRPPLPQKITVAGRTGLGTITTQLINMRDGGFISEYDYFIGRKLAEVICGGDIDGGSVVDEEWLLTLEREVFVELLRQKKTMDRIGFMLENNKPLRN
jgi:3-hydroxyacyl-CoA dehydrogenase